MDENINTTDFKEIIKLIKTQQTRPVKCTFCTNEFKDKRRANKCIMSHNPNSPVYQIKDVKKRNSSEVTVYSSPSKRMSSSYEEIEFDKITDDLKAKEKFRYYTNFRTNYGFYR